jgi:hypothetical protein
MCPEVQRRQTWAKLWSPLSICLRPQLVAGGVRECLGGCSRDGELGISHYKIAPTLFFQLLVARARPTKSSVERMQSTAYIRIAAELGNREGVEIQ